MLYTAVRKVNRPLFFLTRAENFLRVSPFQHDFATGGDPRENGVSRRRCY